MRTTFAALMFLLSSFLSAGEVKVMSYNLCNYFVEADARKIKGEDSKQALMETIRAANPDIMLVIELGGEDSLKDLTDNLNKAGIGIKFGQLITGEDESRHIALLAKFAPLKFEDKSDYFYKIKPKDNEKAYPERVFVQRGFIHAVFEFENKYRLHIVGAHLKSRLFHPRYNQTDMRRYEARMLRYLVNEILEKEDGANILVVGDMNDSFNTDPLVTIRAPEKKIEEQLFDLRPLDYTGMSWTHWWNSEDAYSRIDFAFASTALLPEINFEKTRIIHLPEYWMFASDHRPLLITIRTENKEKWENRLIQEMFPGGVRLNARE